MAGIVEVGDSSDVLAAEALRFIGTQVHAGRKSFTALWYPSPHEPWVALPQDRCSSPAGTPKSKYYGELRALIDQCAPTMASSELWFITPT